VPLAADHYFFVPLWTNFRPGPEPGILDWYTILCALVTMAAVVMHGALYLILKTGGEFNERLRRIVKVLWPAQVALSMAAVSATMAVRPGLLDNYRRGPEGWVIPALVAAGLGGIVYFTRRRRERDAFLSSCVYILATLAGAAYALYPALLPSSNDPANSLTIRNAAAGAGSLSAGIGWWTAGMLVAVGYFVVVYRMFRGKVTPSGHT